MGERRLERIPVELVEVPVGGEQQRPGEREVALYDPAQAQPVPSDGGVEEEERPEDVAGADERLGGAGLASHAKYCGTYCGKNSIQIANQAAAVAPSRPQATCWTSVALHHTLSGTSALAGLLERLPTVCLSRVSGRADGSRMATVGASCL